LSREMTGTEVPAGAEEGKAGLCVREHASKRLNKFRERDKDPDARDCRLYLRQPPGKRKEVRAGPFEQKGHYETRP